MPEWGIIKAQLKLKDANIFFFYKTHKCLLNTLSNRYKADPITQDNYTVQKYKHIGKHK